jgi:AcrR family transcriptional regulator
MQQVARGQHTKEALIRTAEMLMAKHGIEAVDLHDIVTAAGQRNRSAVLYHFGGRDGLVAAIVAKHRTAIDAERSRMLDQIEASGQPTVRALAEAAILPLAASLQTPSGRDYLVILSERATRLGSAGVYAGRGPIASSVQRANVLLDQIVPGRPDARRRRIGEMELVVPVLLADIARDINRRRLTVGVSSARVDCVIDLFIRGLGGNDPGR